MLIGCTQLTNPHIGGPEVVAHGVFGVVPATCLPGVCYDVTQCRLLCCLLWLLLCCSANELPAWFMLQRNHQGKVLGFCDGHRTVGRPAVWQRFAAGPAERETLQMAVSGLRLAWR